MDRNLPFAYGTGGHINKSALTLIELLFGTALTLFVIAGAVTLYVTLQTSWQDTSAVLETERTATLATERLLRGFRTNSDTAPRGLLDAKSFTIDGQTRIDFISGIDSKQRSFYLADNKLMYDPDTSVSSNEVPVAGNILDITFAASAANPGRAVTISLTAYKTVGGVNKTADIATTVFLRNG